MVRRPHIKFTSRMAIVDVLGGIPTVVSGCKKRYARCKSIWSAFLLESHMAWLVTCHLLGARRSLGIVCRLDLFAYDTFRSSTSTIGSRAVEIQIPSHGRAWSASGLPILSCPNIMVLVYAAMWRRTTVAEKRRVPSGIGTRTPTMAIGFCTAVKSLPSRLGAPLDPYKVISKQLQSSSRSVPGSGPQSQLQCRRCTFPCRSPCGAAFDRCISWQISCEGPSTTACFRVLLLAAGEKAAITPFLSLSDLTSHHAMPGISPGWD